MTLVHASIRVAESLRRGAAGGGDMSLISADSLDAAIEAYWNAIPCHLPWKEYLAAHPERESVLAKHRELMRAAIVAAIKEEGRA